MSVVARMGHSSPVLHSAIAVWGSERSFVRVLGINGQLRWGLSARRLLLPPIQSVAELTRPSACRQ